jgi:OmpA-OmpF porin, OOP family
MKLSERRAFAIKDWLEKKSSTNFPDGRISIKAHGSSSPLVPNETAEGRAKNRRVEIIMGN